MKIYISGPMTGIEKFNFSAFDSAHVKFTAQGWEVFSPADKDRSLLGKELNWMPSESDSVGPWKHWAIPNAPTLRQMLGADLKWISEEADAIYMLKGWEKSMGARAEHATAVCLGLQIIYE